jgi:hypothetical protein
MPAGRPHETVGNDGPRWMTAVSRQREAQNPAYRPTHPPFIALTWNGARLGRWRRHFGGTLPPRERPIERIACPAAGLGDQMAVQVDGGGDRLVPSQRGTSEIGTPSARAVLAKVCRRSWNFDSRERAPMRMAEAPITLGVPGLAPSGTLL